MASTSPMGGAITSSRKPLADSADELSTSHSASSVPSKSTNPPLPEFTHPGLHQAICDRIARISDLDRKRSVLDLGCGSGALLKRLQGLGFTGLIGVDKNVTEFAANDVARFVASDLNLGPPSIPGLQCGLVTAVEVIEHLESPSNIMRCAVAHLGPGGYLLLTSPNIYSVRIRARFLLSGKLPFFDVGADPDHLSPLLLTGIDKLSARYGFELIDLWTYPSDGSNGARPIARMLAKALAWFVPNNLPGDNLCVLARLKG
jgi:SAM-dependent methyltransferase